MSLLSKGWGVEGARPPACYYRAKEKIMDQNTMAFMFEEQLKTFSRYRGEPRHFCYWNHGFACLERYHTKDPHPVLMSLEQRHYDDGLTSKEWDVLFIRAAQAWEDDHK